MRTYWYFLFIFLFRSYSLQSQTNNNRTYDLGQKAVSFASAIIDNNTVEVYGTCMESGKNTFGLLFTKLDTNGNVLNYSVFNDSLGDDFTQPSPDGFIKLRNNSGYIGVGQFFHRSNGYFARYDADGVLLFIKEYPDSISITDYYKEIIEIDNGFLIAGRKFREIGQGIVFLMRVDEQGNKLWEKQYGTDDLDDGFGSLLFLNNNEYVIGSYSTNLQGVSNQNRKYTSRITAIDSLGNIKWNWSNQASLEELGVGSLFRNQDGNWVYQTAKGVYDNTYNEIHIQPKFVVRNQNFDFLSQVEYGTVNSNQSYFYSTTQLSDGGWICAGTQSVRYPIPPIVGNTEQNALSGWIVRINSATDSIWGRIDTSYWSYTTGSENYLYSIKEMQSGNFISVGYANKYDGPDSPQTLGWFIKVHNNGCVDTFDCSTLILQNIYKTTKIKVSPNPSNGFVQITLPNNFSGLVNISTQIGKPLRSIPVQEESTKILLDFTNDLSGLYFISLIDKEGRIISYSKIVITH